MSCSITSGVGRTPARSWRRSSCGGRALIRRQDYRCGRQASGVSAAPRESGPARVDRPASPSSSSMRSSWLYFATRSRARRGAGLDLAGVGGDGEVGDRRVLGLARAVRDHGRVAVALRQLDRVERLGQRADLVHLDQDRVGDARARCRARGARGWSRRGRRRRAGRGRRGARVSARPAVPVVLGEPVLDRDDRVRAAPARPRTRPSRPRRASLLAVELVDAVLVELASRPRRARCAIRSRCPARSTASRIASSASSVASRSGAKPPSSPTAVASPRSAAPPSACGRPRRPSAAPRRSARRPPGRS